MRISRTVLALLTLIVGVVALLVLRYDPEVYARLLDHPILMALLVGLLALTVAVQITYHARDPKRAVVFKGGRFDRLDPRGDILLWPGTDVGSEVSLAEHRVLGWPIMVYDIEGKEQSIIFALTWRIVPTSTHPETERERRMLMMSNDERRRIVIQELEYIVRDVARNMTIDGLKLAFTIGDQNQNNDRTTVEAVRKQLLVRLRPDALTVDRLHVVRFIPPEKKDEPKPYREKRTVKETQDWQGHMDREADGPRISPCERDCRCGCHSACTCTAHRQCGCSCGCGCDSAGHRSCDCECHRHCTCDAHHSAKRDVTGHREIKREEEFVRGAQDKNGGDGGGAKSQLTAADHATIVRVVMERLPDIRDQYTAALSRHAHTDHTDVLLACVGDVFRQQGELTALAPFSVAQRIRPIFASDPVSTTKTNRIVDPILRDIDFENPSDVIQKLNKKARDAKDKGDKVVAGACELAVKVVTEGTKSIYNPGFYQSLPAKSKRMHLPSDSQIAGAQKAILKADVRGTLEGYVLGAAFAKLFAESPMAAAAVLPQHPGLTAEDVGITCAVESSIVKVWDEMHGWVR